jgi:hypothetical protein
MAAITCPTKNAPARQRAKARAITPGKPRWLQEVVMLQGLVRRVGARRLWGWLALLCLGLLSVDAMALSCPDNREPSGGLCYLKPRDGYTCTATLCVQNCRAGYHSTGIGTCHYSGSTTYTERPYTSRSRSGMQRCLALFYRKCRDGYRMDVCGICSYKGAWDITRDSYDRGPGINPDVSSAFNRLSDTTRATWGRLLAGIQRSFAQMLAALQGLAQDALYAAAKGVAAEKVAEDVLAAQLEDVSTKLAALKQNPDTLNVLKRLVVAGATGKADPQVALDMLDVVTRLGLVNNTAGIRSFGVFGQVEAAAGAGPSNTVGIAMNIPASLGNPGNLDPRVFMSQGLVYGAAGGAIGSLGVFLVRGDVRSLNGPSISVGLDAAFGGGGNVGVGFSLPTTLPAFDILNLEDAYKTWLRGLAPTFSVGVSGGIGGGLSAAFGYGTTAQLK